MHDTISAIINLHAFFILSMLCLLGQVAGNDLQGMDMEVLREISPKRTRAESKLLLHMIRDIESASQVCDVEYITEYIQNETTALLHVCCAEPLEHCRGSPTTQRLVPW